jgi:hypothetical protein
VGAVNLALIIPVFIVAGILLAGVEWGARQARAAAARKLEQPPLRDGGGDGP